MLASGYEVGAEQLRGKADVVSLKAGQGNVTVIGSQTTFRSWPRALWPLVANSVYHGPSSAVSAADIKTLSAAAVAQESGEPPAEPEPETPAPTTSAPEVKAEPVATPAATPGGDAGADAGGRRGRNHPDQGHRLLQAGQEPARDHVHDQGREGRRACAPTSPSARRRRARAAGAPST